MTLFENPPLGLDLDHYGIWMHPGSLTDPGPHLPTLEQSHFVIASAAGVACRWFVIVIDLAVGGVGVELVITIGATIRNVRIVSSMKLINISTIIFTILIIIPCLPRT